MFNSCVEHIYMLKSSVQAIWVTFLCSYATTQSYFCEWCIHKAQILRAKAIKSVPIKAANLPESDRSAG